MNSEEYLRRELERLQKENAELRSGAGSHKRYTVQESQFKGHPVLTFNGPGLIQPLTLGLGKLRAVEAGWRQVVEFLAKHPPSESDKTAHQDDDRI